MALQLIRGLTRCSFSLKSIRSSQINCFSLGGVLKSDKDMIDLPDDLGMKLPIPTYPERTNEPEHLQRARLLYQSRKRGMLENGLLLSTFAAKYLDDMTTEQLQQYDRLINLPTNDWDIYYWATGVKEIPPEFENDMMKLFIEHVQNKDQSARIRQPDLYSTEPTVDLYSDSKRS